ncbi:MAG: helix-turn-helix domain-containing protein [Chloroflexales bacterium]|nr:helix-turn-helix domain-containing protein [Chloroflexales bacterium]
MAKSRCGQWIKRQRKILDLTQAELARQIGCATDTLRKIEAGKLRPSRQLTLCLARYLNIPPREHAAFIRFVRTELCANPGTQHDQFDEQAPWRMLHPSTNLPTPHTVLIGREHELAIACKLLQREQFHVLTFTGPGGAGKTHLALQVAADLSDLFPHGVFFVGLAALHDPTLLFPAIAQILGIEEHNAQPLDEELKTYLHDKRILLLLDHFDHLPAAAPLVVELLTAAPHLKLLITSRSLLHLADEYEFPVPSLALPNPQQLPLLHIMAETPAVALFTTQAQIANPQFELTVHNAATIAEICARLEGLPLALELVAPWTRHLTPQAILLHLASRIVCSNGKRNNHAQSLRAALDWRYDLLTLNEQRLFARLAIFVGGCTLQAIEAVCSDQTLLRAYGAAPPAPLESLPQALRTLCAHHLLRQEQSPDGAIRFSMHEAIREYAWEQLEEIGEAETVHSAHALYFMGLAEANQVLGSSPEQITWPNHLAADHSNLYAALRWTLDGNTGECVLQISATPEQWRQVRGPLAQKNAYPQVQQQTISTEVITR